MSLLENLRENSPEVPEIAPVLGDHLSKRRALRYSHEPKQCVGGCQERLTLSEKAVRLFDDTQQETVEADHKVRVVEAKPVGSAPVQAEPISFHLLVRGAGTMKINIVLDFGYLLSDLRQATLK